MPSWIDRVLTGPIEAAIAHTRAMEPAYAPPALAEAVNTLGSSEMMNKVGAEGRLAEYAEIIKVKMASMAANLSDERAVEAAFKKADVDNSGSLSREELAQLVNDLGSDMEVDEVAAALAALDTDANGTVEYQEFLGWWKTTL
mmetsp:Transcript_22839/g.59757  ORF Transcript_22839/g.59757 Transcript_22839/m.59757 type:complete len:143 (-) Transcript_22839:548-976(-)